MSGATTHYTTPADCRSHRCVLGTNPFGDLMFARDSKRYVDLYYTVVGTMALGKISAFGGVAHTTKMT